MRRASWLSIPGMFLHGWYLDHPDNFPNGAFGLLDRVFKLWKPSVRIFIHRALRYRVVCEVFDTEFLKEVEMLFQGYRDYNPDAKIIIVTIPDRRRKKAADKPK
jgi:hypothetical protein